MKSTPIKNSLVEANIDASHIEKRDELKVNIPIPTIIPINGITIKFTKVKLRLIY